MTRVNVTHPAALVEQKPRQDLHDGIATHDAEFQKEHSLSLCPAEPKAAESELLSLGTGRLPQPSAIPKKHWLLPCGLQTRARRQRLLRISPPRVRSDFARKHLKAGWTRTKIAFHEPDIVNLGEKSSTDLYLIGPLYLF